MCEKHGNMTENSELRRIVDGCKQGDQRCFSQLVDIYANRCYSYFYRLTGNKAVSDDLLSELFVKLVEKIGSFRGDSFEGWLFKVAGNVFHDYLRGKQRRQKLYQGRKELLESQKTHILHSDSQKVDQLQIQLEKLDCETKELILLRFYSQMTFKEIAKMRSESIGTTLSKVHRGLKKLRELIENG